MDLLPEEILRYVLLKLPVKTMIRCRQVSKVWKDVVDDCTKCDEFWKGRCAADYSEIYLEAKRKALPSLTWRELYQSLSAWSNFDQSRVRLGWKAPFCVVGVDNGMVVMRKDKIVKVVDVNKKKVNRAWGLYGFIFKYYENENFIAVMRDDYSRPSLEIFVKEGNKVTDTIFEIESVKDCICVNNSIYYAKYDRGVCRYDFNGHESCSYETSHDLNENEHKLLFEVDVDNIIAMSHKNNNVMVILKRIEDSIMIVYNEETAMVTQQILPRGGDIFQTLVNYDFTKHMVEENWANINKTMGAYLRGTYKTLKQHCRGFFIITSFKQYGDTVFVGGDMGYFFVFRNPYHNGKINFNTKPVMKFRNKIGNVYHIDVIESKNGPTLIVSMDKNVFALKLHCGNKMEKEAKSASSSTRYAGAKRKYMQ